ncbi:MAG: ATP-dependent Clp protease ATP-binding subunit, partial [Lachnospiraceae bacterium]|nr:ATP-dependent Clp protease ATP-binding subunit [Lachnospiraceae bacterium]
MKKSYTEEANNVLYLAGQAAVSHRQTYTGTEHLLVGLARSGGGTAARVLDECGLVPEKLEKQIDRLVAPPGGMSAGEASDRAPGFSPRARKTLAEAESVAVRLKIAEVGTECILLAILSDRECLATRLLHTLGIDIRKLQNDTLSAIRQAGGASAEAVKVYEQGKDRYGSTPVLDQFSRDLTEMAADGRLDPVFGRSDEILRVMQILGRRTKNNPCLIGEPGVGKTAIVEGLALRIASGDVPEVMRGRRLVKLDLSAMVAGTRYRGEFEERIRSVVREVEEDRNILLFIDELHTLIGAGSAEGSLDASNILKPSLSRGEIQVIGATTVDEYRKYVERDAALERRFQPVSVEEPGEEESVKILNGLKPYYEKHHGVIIEDSAIRAAV